jgi:hypothetical protein
MKLCTLAILVTLFLITAAFEKDAQAAEDMGHEHEHESRLSLFSLVKPLGIATLCLVSVTFLTGLFRRKLGKKFLKVHVPLAITSVILGLAHGTLVFILFG